MVLDLEGPGIWKWLGEELLERVHLCPTPSPALLGYIWLPGIHLQQLKCIRKGLKFRLLASLERPTQLQHPLPEYIRHRDDGWVESGSEPWEQNLGLHERVVTEKLANRGR